MIRLILSIALQVLALFLSWLGFPLAFIGAGIASAIVLFLRPRTRLEIN